MKKFLFATVFVFSFATNAQNVQKEEVKREVIRILDSINKSKELKTGLTNELQKDSLKETLANHSLKLERYGKQLSGFQTVLDKLSKIKISGYIQAQYENYDVWSAGIHGSNPVTNAAPITNSFSLRRARVKFTYEALDGVTFVLCPNFEIDKVRLTDVYVRWNDHWLNTFSLWVGLFNRPTYELEYSSSSRAFAERSLVTRTLYPQERDQGAKLEANFATKFKIPLKIQIAVLNGNFGTGAAANQVKDVDNTKDVMLRAVYSLKFPKKGFGIDFGGHGYFGNNKIIAQTAIPAQFTDENGTLFTPKVGDNLKKQWFGAEMQLSSDFLGGTFFKTEYIAGTMSGFKATDFPTQVNTLFTINNKVRNIEGYYFSLIKNISKTHILSVRYDVFDSNTNKSGDQVATIDDLKFENWTFAYQYLFSENIKMMLSYTMPFNEKSANPSLTNPDFANIDHKDNTLTIRLQSKF